MISREKLIRLLNQKKAEYRSSNYKQIRRGICKAISIVHDMSTVDAVEVVRCKDCLNAMKITESERFKWNLRDDALQCGLIGHIVLPDGYCDGGVKADAEVEE